MRVFVAGGTGVLGRRLVPQLVARGHQVTATTTSASKSGLLERLGARPVVMDGLDASSVGEAVAQAGPEVIVHQMTGISLAHADNGGKAPLWGKGIFGGENVARLLVSILPPFIRIGGAVQPHIVNGQPGAIFRDRDGKVVNTWALDILGGQVQTIRTVINPDKLAHVGPVADAWTVLDEVAQARPR